MKKLFLLSVITAAIFSTQVMAKMSSERKNPEHQNVTDSKSTQKGGVKSYPPEHGSGFITPEKPHKK
ncbi:hypothetical protein [Symbiopectobacterium purcellii]|uniref:hypothetical protein n=1 Tax=Symbiopectobacterium purcellii TaxID=2871826 RepID=UPI003F868C1D